MDKKAASLEGFHRDLADRFGALGKLFSQLDTPTAAREFLDSLLAGNGDHARLAVDDLQVGVLGKCFWLRSIVERVVSTPTGYVLECRLREDLSGAEIALYVTIARRHRQAAVPGAMEAMRELGTGAPIIPQGPFLEELRANHLVTCERRMTYDTSTALILGKPERVCV
jgi:hypothetical protein